MSRASKLTAVLAASFSFAGVASAQVLYGALAGEVVDQTGAVVGGATVTITNTGTNQVRESTSSSDGNYGFQNLLPGRYDVRVSMSGFRTLTRTGIDVSVNNITRLPLALELGQVADQVTVEAGAVQLQTDKSDVHVELGQKEVTNMPLPRYRNYQSLINLVPGATPGRYQNSPGSTPGRALTTNVNGVNRNNNITKLDGAVTVHIWLPHHTAYVAPSETIETVNISTNNFDAEQGFAAGAATTVQTKSGTNDLHGSAFLFHDNSYFGAKNFFFRDPKTPKSLVTIPGFTLGGPIKKDKLFFFGGWEGLRERLNRSRLYTLPTADQRTGNFSAYGNTAIYDPQSGAAADRLPFPNNTIPLARQSSISRKLQDLIPATNQAGVVNNFFNSGTQSMDRDNFDLKVNYNRTTKHQMWAKYSMMRALVTGEYGLAGAGGQCLCDAGVGDARVRAQLSTIGSTYTITPTLVWDGTFGWTRTHSEGVPRGYGVNFGLDTLGIPGTNGASIRESGMPAFNISGYSTLGHNEGWSPYFYNDTSYTMAQNFGWNRGKHDVRFGFEGVRHHLNHWQPEIGSGPRGAFNFNQTVTGRQGIATNQYNGWASYLLGLPNSGGKSLQWAKATSFNYQLGFFFRDRWQVTRKLTMTIGLRYELYPLMTRSGFGGVEQWDENTNLVQFGGAGGNEKSLGITTSKKMLAPRFGLAYRLNEKTVIRSGYGITYNPMPFARPLRGFFPFTIAQDFPAPNTFVPAFTLAQGIPEFSGPDISKGSAPLPVTAQMRTIAGDSITRGYTQSWNLFVEREMPGKIIAAVGYVGTQTVRSFGDWEANAAAPGAGVVGRPFAARFGRTASTLYWNGFLSGGYHGLQTSINRRVAGGLMLKGAYTYSKVISMADDDGWQGLTFNYLPHFRRNRAQAGYNIPHMFQMGFVYDLPFGKGKQLATNAVASKILGGWQANGVFMSVQGRPFTVTADGGALNAPGNTQTADQLKTVVEKVGAVEQFYDRTAFGPVTTARFGTSGRNILRGPGVVNFDLSLFRDIPVKEWLKLQFRAEAFNATNTPHLLNPSANVNAGDFMRISAADPDQRTFRFGLRAQW